MLETALDIIGSILAIIVLVTVCTVFKRGLLVFTGLLTSYALIQIVALVRAFVREYFVPKAIISLLTNVRLIGIAVIFAVILFTVSSAIGRSQKARQIQEVFATQKKWLQIMILVMTLTIPVIPRILTELQLLPEEHFSLTILVLIGTLLAAEFLIVYLYSKAKKNQTIPSQF